MVDWHQVRDLLISEYAQPHILRPSQINSLQWVADHLVQHGVLLADEVGLGKTRIAVAVIHAVHRLGGKSLAIVPPRLMHQWEGEYRELTRDLKAAAGASRDVSTEARGLVRRHLRTYWQLFENEAQFPLLQRVPFALVSHNFGIPLRLGKASKEWRWILPLLVLRAQAKRRDYRRRYRGLRRIERKDEIQILDGGARWLVNDIDDQLMNRVRALDLTIVKAGEPYRSVPECSEARAVYTALIGHLIGAPDLVVIDEAHKNREELDENDEGHASKRLPLLLGAFPPGGSARRLALTATPMEMSASDWKSMLQRLGEPSARVKERCKKILEFEQVRKEMRTAGPGDEVGLERLIGAARSYEKALEDIMVRRRWRDEVLMTEFRDRMRLDTSSNRQSHRRWLREEIRLESLDHAGRAAVLAAEGLTLSALGADVGFREKQQAARYSAGLCDPYAEAEEGESDALSGISEEVVNGHAADSPRQAKLARAEYWRRALRRYSVESHGAEVAALGHPRVTSAIGIIEKATAGGEKVLVFGMLNQPLRALNRALNARHHLRELAEGRATLRPTAISDADLMFCATQLASDSPNATWPKSRKELEERERRALKSYRRLERQRVELVNFVTQDLGLTDGPHAPLARRWVSQLLLDRQLGHSDGRLTAEVAQKTVEEAFEAARRDVTEPGDLDAASDDETPSSANLRQDTLTRLADALHDEVGTQEGRNVPIQRSPFSRLLIGETKPLTQRILQATFNQPGLNPRVLVSQARVGSEGLNLQRACKRLLLFHLDWNPARIEQQIGRIDRYASLWTAEATEWLDRKLDSPPFIEVIALTFGGTYDELKTSRILGRMQSLKAFLFGEILEPEVMEVMPARWRERLEEHAPDFSP